MIKILIGSLLFVGLYNLFFYPTAIGIGLGLLFAILHIYLFFVRTKHPKNLFLAVGLSILSVFFAGAIGWRANGFVQEIDLLLALFLTICAAYFYKKEHVFTWGMFSFFIVPLAALGESLVSGYQFFTQNSFASHTQSHKAVYGFLRGVIIAIPVLVVLFKLLSGADPIFAKLFGNVSFSVSLQAIISLFLFTLAFFWGITTVKDRFFITHIENEKPEIKGSIPIEALVVTVSAALLFGLYLYIQIKYLFIQVPEIQLQHLGINIKTYSEYVRQGFFQLLIAAGIATSIVAYILQTFHTIARKQKLPLQLSMMVLTLETEFLLVSAAKRLYLYAGAHGLTISRILGIVFLVWLSTVLLLMVVGTVKRIKKMYFFIIFFVITMSAFISINVLSIDSIIATSYPPTVNEEVDYIYITMLSPDAAISWPSFIRHAQDQWQTLAKADIPSLDQTRKVGSLNISLTRLGKKVDYLDRKYPITKTWQAFNFSEYQAYMLIQTNRPLFDQILSLKEAIAQKEREWSNARLKLNQQNQKKL